MPDNNSTCNTTFNFDHKLYQYSDWKNYEIKYRFQTNPALAPVAALEPILNNFFATYAGPAGFTGSLKK